MCGIVGISSTYKFIPSVTQLLQGLRLLQNRGYDSAGIAMLVSDQIACCKHASTDSNNSITLLERNLDVFLDARTGIAHTRWATHGGKTDPNAHPHMDPHGEFAIVHNGIIENHTSLRDFLSQAGYVFHSQTDSEVICHLLAFHHRLNGGNVQKAISAVMDSLEGTYAVAMVTVHSPDTLFAFCHGSPLVVGIDATRGISMVASELLGFGNNDLEYSYLMDRSVAELRTGHLIIHHGSAVSSTDVLPLPLNELEFDQGKYHSWLEKEIWEQPHSAVRAFNNGGRFSVHGDFTIKLGGLERQQAKLLTIDHLVLLGCGTSYYAGMFCLDVFRRLTRFHTVSLFDGAEFHAHDIPKGGVTGFVFLSQSGETKDLHRCLHLLPSTAVTIGVINVVHSLIARSVDCGVYLNAGREVSVASTKSFVNMVVVLHLIAGWFAERHCRLECTAEVQAILSDISFLSSHIQNVLDDNTLEQPLVEYLSTRSNPSVFVLGRGTPGEASALEASLKLKEIAYLHAEGKSAASLKHGPFALIDHGMPVVFIDDGSSKMANAIHEVSARDSHVFVLSETQGLPRNGTFAALLCVIVLQKVAMRLAYRRGYDPDYPRNLAKVVTVE